MDLIPHSGSHPRLGFCRADRDGVRAHLVGLDYAWEQERSGMTLLERPATPMLGQVLQVCFPRCYNPLQGLFSCLIETLTVGMTL